LRFVDKNELSRAQRATADLHDVLDVIFSSQQQQQQCGVVWRGVVWCGVVKSLD